jgi:hypothetical protein
MALERRPWRIRRDLDQLSSSSENGRRSVNKFRARTFHNSASFASFARALLFDMPRLSIVMELLLRGAVGVQASALIA